ncbi:MAG TPA: LamG domain-containing protein [Polyangiaceae bacterium]
MNRVVVVAAVGAAVAFACGKVRNRSPDSEAEGGRGGEGGAVSRVAASGGQGAEGGSRTDSGRSSSSTGSPRGAVGATDTGSGGFGGDESGRTTGGGVAGRESDGGRDNNGGGCGLDDETEECQAPADVPDIFYFEYACNAPNTCTLGVCWGPHECQDSGTYKEYTMICCGGFWYLLSGADSYYSDPASAALDCHQGRLAPLPVDCGGPGSEAPPSSYALAFNGSSTKLELPLTSIEGSVELWFRTAVSSGSLLAASNGAWALYLSAGKACISTLPTAGELVELCTTETSFADGEWHHLAVSGSFGALRRTNLYVDGVARSASRVSSTTDREIDGSAGADATAGYGPSDASGTPGYFTGALDEIRLWNVVLVPPEVNALYLGMLGTEAISRYVVEEEDYEGGLVAYWPLEESGSAATAPDIGFGARAGTLVGFSFDTSPWVAPGAH